jgi:hypothetical protein
MRLPPTGITNAPSNHRMKMITAIVHSMTELL